MARGNPPDARHPIRGLETGDPIAFQFITTEIVHRGDSRIVADIVLRVAEAAPAHVSDLLVVAIPVERRAAVMASLERAIEASR